MEKSADAFRTISEVAEHLDTPAHVLRFWESRFPQIKPVKRAGGRRYYRPSDVALLVGIRRLLHDEGMTIRGVQKILREQGVRHVAGLLGDAPDSDMIEAQAVETDAADGAAPSAPAPDPGLDALIARTMEAASDAPAGLVAPVPQPAPAPAAAAPAMTAVPEQMPLFSPVAAPAPVAREEDAETVPLANRLRSLRKKQMAPRRTQLKALAARLARLRDTLASAPPTPRN
jgi:DNA-binding transcriptional MerR regulator